MHKIFLLPALPNRRVRLTLFLLISGLGNIHAQIKAPSPYNSMFRVNYIRQWDAIAPLTNPDTIMARPLPDVLLTTQYFDGLGRPLQTIVRKGSMVTGSAAVDLVTPVVYDALGREQYKYLPFASNVQQAGDITDDGNFKFSAFQQDSAFNKVQFSGETYYYAQTNFEKNPLSRVTAAYAPGNSWVGSGRGAGSQYSMNTVSDSVQLWKIGPAIQSLPVRVSDYAANQLYKNSTTDEANHQVIEYKDKEGLVILKKVQLSATPGTAHAGWLCTYYVYDTLQNLRFVLQPRAVELINSNWTMTTAIANEFCFRYEYDTRKRMIIKKIPGAGETWMVYDTRNRLVLSQDSSLRFSGKWMVTEYDSIGRPCRTGLLTNANNRIYHQNLASLGGIYPNTSSNYDVQTETYYDNYDWLASNGNPFNISRYAGDDGRFLTPNNSAFPYPQPITQCYMTRGQVTGTKRKVIGSGSQYLYSILYYDQKNRLLQTQAFNVTGGWEVATNQYSFSGQLLINYSLTNNGSAGATQATGVLSSMDPDNLSRVIKIHKSIATPNGTGNLNDKIILQNEYDALGRVKHKNIGNKPGYAAGTPLAKSDYQYNIRGWLLSVNKDYIPASSNSDQYFGFELGYDKAPQFAGAWTAQQYDGNIAGMIWKSEGDQQKRKYDFGYDNAGRILSANFNQYVSGSGPGALFDKSAGLDFSLTGMAYDANGNIQTLNHKGFKVTGSVTIDSLLYTYQTNSNKLAKVSDRIVTADNGSLADFKDGSNGASDDYSYDGNGNLALDNNKAISSIKYNYLNLPDSITVTGKGGIKYTYDATGTKLRKTTTENGATVNGLSTSIITSAVYAANGAAVYESKNYTNGSLSSLNYPDRLQYIAHEEGRFRLRQTDGNFLFDYFLKDHLGNIRMVLTEQKDTARYLATMEAAYRTTENQLFYNIPASNYQRTLSTYPNDVSVTNPNDSIMKLNGSGQKTGAAIVLKVMAGDSVSLGTSVYFTSGSGTGTSNSLVPVLASFANGIVAAAAGGKGSLGDLNNQTTSPLFNALGSYTPTNNPDISGKPRAYLNWILLDDQLKYDGTTSAAANLSGVTAGTRTPLAGTFKVKKNGFLYVYVNNETQNWDVFFDNLSIQHFSGPLLEETHYYPFGLTMAGISSKALKSGYAENRKKYNGIEFDNDLDLNEYEAFYRDLDPQTGRWWQIDPKVDAGYESISPYASMYDDPEKYSDPLGDEGEEANDCCKYLKNAFASVSGATLGFIDNNVPFSNLRGAVANSGIIEDPDVADAWNKGLDAADAFGVVQGTAETTTGAAVFDASLTVTASTGGASIEISGPGMLAGGGLSLHGVFVANKSANNLISQNGRVNIESKKQTGSYTNTHDSGKTYSGKGSQDRAKQSGERVAKEHSDPVKKTAWKPSKNNREAFKAEDKRINRNGGAGNTKKNYNKINSPGKKYNKEDN